LHGARQKRTSGRGRHTAAQQDGKRNQQACQPGDRTSHVIVAQMHLKRPGFRERSVARKKMASGISAAFVHRVLTLTVTVQIEKNRIVS
jgi:hypothetical protein